MDARAKVNKIQKKKCTPLVRSSPPPPGHSRKLPRSTEQVGKRGRRPSKYRRLNACPSRNATRETGGKAHLSAVGGRSPSTLAKWLREIRRWIGRVSFRYTGIPLSPQQSRTGQWFWLLVCELSSWTHSLLASRRGRLCTDSTRGRDVQTIEALAYTRAGTGARSTA